MREIASYLRKAGSSGALTNGGSPRFAWESGTHKLLARLKGTTQLQAVRFTVVSSWME